VKPHESTAGVRIVEGEPRYSAAWLDRPPALVALETARAAWVRQYDQLSLDMEGDGEK
jgi:hypothetical protein